MPEEQLNEGTKRKPKKVAGTKSTDTHQSLIESTKENTTLELKKELTSVQIIVPIGLCLVLIIILLVIGIICDLKDLYLLIKWLSNHYWCVYFSYIGINLSFDIYCWLENKKEWSIVEYLRNIPFLIWKIITFGFIKKYDSDIMKKIEKDIFKFRPIDHESESKDINAYKDFIHNWRQIRFTKSQLLCESLFYLVRISFMMMIYGTILIALLHNAHEDISTTYMDTCIKVNSWGSLNCKVLSFFIHSYQKDVTDFIFYVWKSLISEILNVIHELLFSVIKR
jgi:hypothetical protein